MSKEDIIFYFNNGDDWQGTIFMSISEAEKRLIEKGYKKYYKGRSYRDSKLTIVGINNNNTVFLKQRRENGLLGAQECYL